MARARNIKPGFFKNEVIADLPMFARLLFIGLWCIADREGRLEDRPKRIKMELFPADDVNVDDALDLIAAGGLLIRYEAEGARYIQIVNFTKHQVPHHKEVASEIPAPPGLRQVTKHAYDVTTEARSAVFERDGHRCLKCGTEEDLSIDHVVPLSKGGDNDVDNLQTLCKTCNSSKGGSTKDYRKLNVEPMLNQRCDNVGASCRTDSLIPDSLIPESGGKTQGAVAPRTQSPDPDLLPAEKPAKPMGLHDLVADGVDRQYAEDWLKVRRAKRAPLTATAWNDLKAEAQKAGITPSEAVRISASNSWQGFKASWLDKPTQHKARSSPDLAERNRQAAEEAKRLIFGEG